ncbi:MAG: dihydroxyacetone kinase subunit DhaL [Eubacteriales bacterium]
MAGFKNAEGKVIVMNMIKAIQDNKEYLSEVDGAIGDGDHGINMNKGFSLCEARIRNEDIPFAEALDTLGTVLFTEIGGSMGPLYGTLFMQMGEVIDGKEVIDEAEFMAMLKAAVDGLHEIVEAKVGDKTLMDALMPAEAAFGQAVADGKSFTEALDAMKKATQEGRDYTVDLVAKFGRASRLGDRSKGVLDAGATSCALILTTMADTVKTLLA